MASHSKKKKGTLRRFRGKKGNDTGFQPHHYSLLLFTEEKLPISQFYVLSSNYIIEIIWPKWRQINEDTEHEDFLI